MSGWSESPPRHRLWSNGGASVEGTEIYGFVGGAWHGLPPLWCHVTALLRQRRVIPGLGGVNERRAQWAGALSLPSKAPDCFLFPASSRTRRSGVALISLCLSVPALPGLDLTIHLRRLCGISQRRRRRRVEDWRCFERSSRWNWLCFFQSFDRNENTFVCLLVVVPTPLTVDVMAVTALPHTTMKVNGAPVRGSQPGHDSLLQGPEAPGREAPPVSDQHSSNVKLCGVNYGSLGCKCPPFSFSFHFECFVYTTLIQNRQTRWMDCCRGGWDGGKGREEMGRRR